MERYAAVYFGPDESKNQREFLKAMSGVGIIELSYNEIKRCVEDFEKEKSGMTNRVVLHSQEEEEKFRNVMNAFLPTVNYEITDDPNDEDFRKWLMDKKKMVR